MLSAIIGDEVVDPVTYKLHNSSSRKLEQRALKGVFRATALACINVRTPKS